MNPSRIGHLLALASPSLAAALLSSAQQNPSPMVGRTREHLRLTETHPLGKRTPLELDTLFVLEGAKHQAMLLFFFHGEDCLCGQLGLLSAWISFTLCRNT